MTTFLYYGGGYQSLSLLLMILMGDIALPSKPKAVVWVDNENEPVYIRKQAEEMMRVSEEQGLPFYRVEPGNMIEDYFEQHRQKKARTVKNVFNIPFYTMRGNDRISTPKDCVRLYKKKPLERFLQKYLSDNGQANGSVDLWMPLTVDEMLRTKQSGSRYIKHFYPLVKLGYTTNDCLRYLKANGYGFGWRSSCVYCPYRTQENWYQLQVANTPDWEKAVEIDNRIRMVENTNVQYFVHKSFTPLAERNEFKEVGNNWINECDGYCGL